MLRRHSKSPDLRPQDVYSLAEHHQAIQEGRPYTTHYVVDADVPDRILVSAVNSRKIGSPVQKGPLKGFPVYTLTLPERMTCPRSCHHYLDCFGNAMPYARRHKPGLTLERRLAKDIAGLAGRHPKGFLVRLHVLGDFYSLTYVDLWERLLARHSSLYVYGYTARQPWAREAFDAEIGRAVMFLRLKFGTRFFIRFSSPDPRPGGATTIHYVPKTSRVPEGLVCPAQTKTTACCATCGLCWSPDAFDETIVFIRHGRPKAPNAFTNTKKRKLEEDTTVAWTEDKVERLKELHAQGYSASQIANRIGGFAHCSDGGRNAVVGKIHRLGLPQSGKASKPKKTRTRNPRTRRAAAPAGAPEPAVAPPAVKVPVSRPPVSLGTKECISDLGPDQCRWPIGDPRDEGFHFCGKQREFGTFGEGKKTSYCAEHNAVAFRPTPRPYVPRARQTRTETPEEGPKELCFD